MPIDIAFGGSDTNSIADTITRRIRGEGLCGQTVVVAWKHEHIPKLANRLAANLDQKSDRSDPFPAKWHGKDFDGIWGVRWSLEYEADDPQTTAWHIQTGIGAEGFSPLRGG